MIRTPSGHGSVERRQFAKIEAVNMSGYQADWVVVIETFGKERRLIPPLPLIEALHRSSTPRPASVHTGTRVSHQPGSQAVRLALSASTGPKSPVDPTQRYGASGNVEERRGDGMGRAWLLSAAFAFCRCLKPYRCSVSSPGSSNRTCGGTGSGFPIGFNTKHTTLDLQH